MERLLKTPRGIRNNNPLNIRKGNNWQGERHPQVDTAFEEFGTMADGCRAAVILAYNYITGRTASSRRQRCDTVEKFITKWAPPTENNTQAYISRVCKRAEFQPGTALYPINKNRLCRLLWAMAEVENGVLLPYNYFETGYAYARRTITSLPI